MDLGPHSGWADPTWGSELLVAAHSSPSHSLHPSLSVVGGIGGGGLLGSGPLCWGHQLLKQYKLTVPIEKWSARKSSFITEMCSNGADEYI